MGDLFGGDSREELLRKLRALLSEHYEIECILGDALGYGRGEEGGPCPGSPVTGDHTSVTLAMEAARVLERLWHVRPSPGAPARMLRQPVEDESGFVRFMEAEGPGS